MNDVVVTINGNVLTDVTIRETKGGHDVASFRLVSTPRRYDRATGQWIDGSPSYFSVSCWRQLARNVSASIRKGMPVIVHGRMTQRPYDREVGGEIVRSYSLDLDAKIVGPDLNRGVASFGRLKSDAVQLVERRSTQDAAAAAHEVPAGGALVA